MFEKFINEVSEVPSLFFQNIIDMSKSIQVKMREYSDATTGKMNPSNVSIASVHANYITTVRSNADMYKTLLQYAITYSNVDIDQQPAMLDKVYQLIISEASHAAQAKENASKKAEEMKKSTSTP